MNTERAMAYARGFEDGEDSNSETVTELRREVEVLTVERDNALLRIEEQDGEMEALLDRFEQLERELYSWNSTGRYDIAAGEWRRNDA